MSRSLCMVVPLGEYDDDLLEPVLEWIKTKMSQKLNGGMSAGRRRTMLLNKQNEHSGNNRNRRLTISAGPDRLVAATDDDEGVSGDDRDDDPFEPTGRPFGSLFNEVRKRYSHYSSDIRDGLNLHCLIASIFIFTVCITPALSFGGILCKLDYYICVFKAWL